MESNKRQLQRNDVTTWFLDNQIIMKIQNSVFLVTGGASDDYGRATVEKLLKEGAKVIICDSPTKDLNIYADDKAIFLPININDDKDTKILAEIIEEKYGRLDGVVNCIDVYKSIPHSLEEVSTIVHDNILGPYNIITCTIPLISKNIPKKSSGRGIIINMSNGAAFDGMCPYAASKNAVIKMTECLNFELQGIQIRSVAIVTNHRKHGINAAAEDIQKFVEMVKTVIEMPIGMSSPVIRVES
ncbi:unnamed protein product [Ceutorhynchus assimilis]|uniref:NAD(P)-binding protein n=1 Tax=Ceutorhynchus assimilis TaxID=467358 RepID=A0A9N9QHH8_9CUCU|nr:unnamed protein product [Ceutorhynchus assimilis]